MADPVSVSISLQGYQQATSDPTISAFIATLKTTLAAERGCWIASGWPDERAGPVRPVA